MVQQNKLWHTKALFDKATFQYCDEKSFHSPNATQK